MSNLAPQVNFKHKDRTMSVASLDEVLDNRVADNQFTCTVIKGDSKEVLPTLAPHSVDLVVTSPPYFQQRSYSAAGIGNESTVNEYLDALVETFVSLLFILKPEGNIVYNLGDKYSDGGLMLVPYRFAMRIIDEMGLILVNDITWVKQNPVPHQFDRRLISSTEPFFHFARNTSYYYDRDAFMPDKTAPRSKPSRRLGQGYRELIEQSDLDVWQRARAHAELDQAITEVKNGAIHSFRMKIRGIHAPAYGGQEGGRKIRMERDGFTIIRISGNRMKRDVIESPVGSLKGNGHPAIFPEQVIREVIRLLSPPDGVVLDHYMGSGTTLVSALKEGRSCIGIDISEEYCEAAVARVQDDEEIDGETIWMKERF